MQSAESLSVPAIEDNLLSRRDFAKLSVAAGVAMAAASGAEAAAPVTQRAVDIKTADGSCDAVLLSPMGSGKSPGVLVWPDAYGLRPASIDIGRRLAGQGYAALVVNQFYRARRAPVFPPGFSFQNPDDRAQLMQLMAVLDHATVSRDARAYLAFLDAQPEVDAKRKLGSVGFCMGGKMTIWTAAVEPGRVGAVASFHGGGLVTDKPESPHLAIASTRAAYHIAIASDDDEKEPQAKTVLKETLAAAHQPATIEVYPGAKHGWMMADSQVFNAEQAERGWVAMLALYRQALV
jgi:carboxymethylenebutenolidase